MKSSVSEAKFSFYVWKNNIPSTLNLTGMLQDISHNLDFFFSLFLQLWVYIFFLRIVGEKIQYFEVKE